MRVVLPWPPKQLTPNFKRRKHWAVYRPFIKQYREDCAWLTKAARVRVAAGDVPILLNITFYPPDRRRRDDDGIIGAFKHGRDGVADGMGVDDHWFKPTYAFADPVKGGMVVVEVLG